MRFLLIFALLFLSACGAEDVLFPLVSDEEHIEIITLGPYTQRCHGAFFEQDCLMVYNEDSGSWGFLFDGVEGFDFQPGFIYILEVRLEDLGPYIQDVGQYAYHLVKIIVKTQAPDNFSYE